MPSKKKIMVIDDAEDHLLICKLVLEHRGYEVLLLPGVDALEQVFEAVYSFRPDVIFTDQEMPGIDGEAIIRMIKQVSQFKHIPVIYFSAMERIDRLATRVGADDYLTKPLKIDQLLYVLTRHIGGE